jgi:uncharacterized protein (TIGR04222 family)
LIAIVLLYVRAARRALTRPVQPASRRRLDVYDLAYLAAGPRRVAQTAAVGLAESGCLAVNARGELAVVAPTAAENPAEDAFLAHLQQEPDVGRAVAASARDPRVLRIGADLATDGYLIDASRLRRLAAPAFAVAACFAVGGVRLITLALAGRSAWWLFAELGLLLGPGSALLVYRSRRTWAAQDALREVRRDWPRYYDPRMDGPVRSRAQTHWTSAVALLGPDALSGTDLHRLLFANRTSRLLSPSPIKPAPRLRAREPVAPPAGHR